MLIVSICFHDTWTKILLYFCLIHAVNDDSEDSDAPRRKKSRRTWHESESEESDWGKKKRK